MLPNPEIDKLIQIAEDTTKMYLDKKTLGTDEELQLLASAYATLFLKAVGHYPHQDLSKAHQILSESYQKIGDTQFPKKHQLLEEAYRKL